MWLIGKRIASLDLKETVILLGIFFKNPSYLLPSYRATRETIKICNRCYGSLHHRDNRTNAFRHALWNYLLCKYCFAVSGSVDYAVSWSKKLTDLHERLSPNKSLAKAMDLHNNKVGRELFRSNFDQKEDILPLLQEMTREAVKVKSLAEIERHQQKLVFIEEVQHKR